MFGKKSTAGVNTKEILEILDEKKTENLEQCTTKKNNKSNPNHGSSYKIIGKCPE